ncbi:MAG: hypothetical protein JWL60_2641 [Gemmatimonadetes bacterium]|jgi:hypothetical protein|nr:hypothetical protein [Gemmatimonadota bacterium]
MFRATEAPGAGGPVPLRRILLWGALGLAIAIGVVLYFRYARQLAPLVG